MNVNFLSDKGQAEYLIEQALKILSNQQQVRSEQNQEKEAKDDKPKHNLPGVVENYQYCGKGSEYNGIPINWVVTIKDKKVPLRYEVFPRRPERGILEKLRNSKVVTVFIFARESLDNVVRKVAMCLKLALDKMRRLRNNIVFKHRHSETRHFRPEIDLAPRRHHVPHPRVLKRRREKPVAEFPTHLRTGRFAFA